MFLFVFIFVEQGDVASIHYSHHFARFRRLSQAKFHASTTECFEDRISRHWLYRDWQNTFSNVMEGVFISCIFPVCSLIILLTR